MKKEEGYTGENEKLFEFNKKIIIERNNSPYLIRRTLITLGKWFSIKYHQIMQSDDVCSHDHPWPFLTIILRGGYYEWTPVYQKDCGIFIDTRIGVDGTMEVCNYHPAGSIMYRPAKWRHQLELMKDSNNDKLIPAKTLVFTFKIIRDWGFITKSGWIYWRNYTKDKHCG